MPCGTQPVPCSAAMGLQQCPTVHGAGEAPPSPGSALPKPPFPSLCLSQMLWVPGWGAQDRGGTMSPLSPAMTLLGGKLQPRW